MHILNWCLSYVQDVRRKQQPFSEVMLQWFSQWMWMWLLGKTQWSELWSTHLNGLHSRVTILLTLALARDNISNIELQVSGNAFALCESNTLLVTCSLGICTCVWVCMHACMCMHLCACAYIWYTRMHAANTYRKKHICGPSIATVHYATL